MPDVEFDEDQNIKSYTFKSRKILGVPTTPGMVTWIVKIKLARNEQQAGRLLIGFVIVIFALSGFIFYDRILASHTPPPQTREELMQMNAKAVITQTP